MVALMTQDFAGGNREIAEAVSNDRDVRETRRRASSRMCSLTSPEASVPSTSGRARQTFRRSPKSD
jgi:hypothetical protein